jgi:hypothetical protein
MANGHGGARRGAGRPRKAKKYQGQIAALEDQVVDRLPDRVAALELLAEGGYEQIEEELVPAGLVFIDDVTVEDGKVIRKRVRAFPNIPEDKLVCIRRKRAFAAPDRAANIYLIDRILGKPGAESDDEDPTTDDERPTPEELLALWTTTTDEPPTTDETSPSSSGT